MGYLKEFLAQIKNRDFHKFLVLWEEYSSGDSVDAEEFSQLLKAVKTSDLAPRFGQIVETALPLWKSVKDKEDSYEILRLLVDLQSTNRPALAEVVLQALEEKYGEDPKFHERLRTIGIRNMENFQGALSKYDLFMHMHKGNIVFHTGGWGTGEIVEVSHLREHLVIEFENVSGRKDLSFANAFKTLHPLPNRHFLARRFSDPDLLEKEAIEDPVGLMKLFLHDMGPKTAAEIKDELCELVISENMWTKWWQGARAKIKKNPLIETPDSLKEPFYLLKAELSSEQRLKQVMQNKTDVNDVLQTIYNFVRDTPAALKDVESKQNLMEQLLTILHTPGIAEEHILQVHLLSEQFFNYEPAADSIKQLIRTLDRDKIEETVQKIDIVAFKKRALLAIKEYRPDWSAVFLSLLFVIPQAQLRDYIMRELSREPTREALEKKLLLLVKNPSRHPEMFVWYFQKLMSEEDRDIPFRDDEGKILFFEAFFILLAAVEGPAEYRELVKKMYGIISAKRYELIRRILKITSLEFAKEFLLLISKCQSLSDHDIKILKSLTEVVHPSLTPAKQRKESEKPETGEIWTTQEGYLKIQDRIRHIGTVEVIENAREIEAARALGDLRENSEFKFAQERRARLQSELKTLSDDLGRARVITPQDIHAHEIGIGSVIELKDSKNNVSRYTILGPWDADPEKNILSFNSKFALAVTGKKQNETVNFRNETYKVLSIGSYLNQ